MSTIAERVARGAALLDEKRPGWWREIDLDRLDLGSKCNCVLGQAVGGYGKGVVRLWGEDFDYGHAQSVDHGFILPGIEVSRWDDLEAEWRRVIEERRG